MTDDTKWKPGDVFILEDLDYIAEFFVCKIISTPVHHSNSWDIKVLIPHNIPWNTIYYGIEKRSIRKIIGDEAKFYELFAN